MKHKILIVDDEPANLRLLERLFRRDYQVITAGSGREALQLLGLHDIAVLITDQRMPGMTGIELMKYTVGLRPHMVRMIITGYTDVSALVEAINCGHVYKYVTKPWDNEALRLTVERAVEHHETSRARHELEQTNRRLSLRLREMTRGLVRAVAEALEAKDEYAYGHARRVSGYALAIGRRMRLPAEKLEEISLASFLHDVGKIGTPDQLLLKPSALTTEERAVVRLHSERGARMLGGVPEMADVAEAIRYHHEHYDGTGYPEGLKAEQIPLTSRIILVADAYDSMTSPRPFRPTSDHYTAMRVLQGEAGGQFDPEVVRAFCQLEGLAKIRSCVELGRWEPRLSPPPPSPTDTSDPAAAVASDPILAAHVLRKANQDFGSLAATADIGEACERLGEEALLGIGQNAGCQQPAAPARRKLLNHSLRCAAAARLLAEKTSIMPPEEAYTLGLLHDIGETLLLSLFPEEMESILWMPDGERVEREIAAFGVDHAQIGRWMLESCGLPCRLMAAVQTHHDALRINDPAALLLHVADVIATAETAGDVPTLDDLGSARLTMLGLTRQDVAALHCRLAAPAREEEEILC